MQKKDYTAVRVIRDGAPKNGAGQKSQGENSMHFNERVDTRASILFSVLRKD
jgi:hypothetical protein